MGFESDMLIAEREIIGALGSECAWLLNGRPLRQAVFEEYGMVNEGMQGANPEIECMAADAVGAKQGATVIGNGNAYQLALDPLDIGLGMVKLVLIEK